MTDAMSPGSPPTSPPPPPAPGPAPRRRGRLGRRLLKLVVVLLVLVLLAPFALGLPFVRHFVADKASAALGRRVTIGGASASWWGGIDLRDVEVHNPEGYSGPPLLAVDRVHVDVAVMKAIVGSIDAAVDVEKPVVTLIRGANGKSNLDGLPPESKEESKPSGSKPTLRAAVRDGRLQAFDASTSAGGRPAAPEVIDAIRLDFRMSGDGGSSVDFSAVAKDAKTGGGDVPISMSASLDGKGAGPVKASVPSLDLARVGKALGAAFHLDSVSGTATVAASLEFAALGGATGEANVTLENLAYRRDEGSVSIAAATLAVKPTPAAGGTRYDVALGLKSLRATGFSKRDAGFEEPMLRVAGAVVRSSDGDLSFGDASAPLRIEGRTLSGSLSGALRRLSSGAPESDLAVSLGAMLSPTLGRLLGVLTSPDDDLRGTVTVKARLASANSAGSQGSLAIDVSGEVRDLSVGGAGGAAPWQEPSITLGVAGTWDGAKKTLSLAKAALAAGAITARAEPGFTFVAGPPSSIKGDAVVDADFARLAGLRALVKSLEVIAGGTLHATIKAVANDDGGRFVADVSGRDLRFEKQSVPGSLDGHFVVTTSTSRKTTTVSESTLRGFGIDAKVAATLSSAPDAAPLQSASVEWTGDLAAIRPALAPFLDLAPDGALGGNARGRVDASPAGKGTSLSVTASVERVHFVGGRDPKTGRAMSLDEATVSLVAKAVMDAEPGLLKIDEAKLVAQSLSATVKGSTRERGGEREVDLSATIDGDLVLLAQHLRSVMGPDYADARGEGRLAGTISVVGPIGRGGRDLRINGDLTARELTASGLTVADAKVNLSRPAPGTPLKATVRSQVNRGTLAADATCDLGKGDSPWAAKATVRGLDTAPLMTAKGTGKALSLVLPAILPAGATTQVLSGLMDANLDVKSSALTSPGITDTLSGAGDVKMTQGEVKDSTLFGGLAGGGGKLGPLLKAVPVVGSTFEQLSRAVAFQELSSVFTIGNKLLNLNPVTLVSPSVSLRFTGTVGFDGSADLDIPLVLGGDAGRAIEKYVKDRTIPLKVTMRPNQKTTVVPVLKMENLGGLVEQGKDLLDGLLGGKKKPR